MNENNQLNLTISDFIRDNCSPTKQERKFTQDEFSFLQDVLEFSDMAT